MILFCRANELRFPESVCAVDVYVLYLKYHKAMFYFQAVYKWHRYREAQRNLNWHGNITKWTGEKLAGTERATVDI